MPYRSIYSAKAAVHASKPMPVHAAAGCCARGVYTQFSKVLYNRGTGYIYSNKLYGIAGY